MVPGASGQNPAEKASMVRESGDLQCATRGGAEARHGEKGKKEGGERDKMKIVPDSQPNGRQGEEEAHSNTVM